MKNFIRTMLLLLVATTIVSCEKEPDYTIQRPDAKEEFVTVTTKTLKEFLMITDYGTQLKVIDYTDLDIEQLKIGERLLATYEPKESNNITLLSYKRTKAVDALYPSSLTQPDRDELGEDRIDNIKTTLTGGKYINLDYLVYYLSPNDVRRINLVVDEEKSTPECIVATIRHNNLDNDGMESKIERISFRVDHLIPEGKNSIDIKISWHPNKSPEPKVCSGTIVRGQVKESVLYTIPK